MIDLKKLSESRRNEISKMEQGIRGETDVMLWTTALRAANRGGKCKIETITDQDIKD